MSAVTAGATATATVGTDGSAVVEINGQPPQQLQAGDPSQARHQAVALVIGYAQHTGQPVALVACDSDTSHLLKIHPDGTVHLTETASPAQHRPGRAPRILICPPTTHRPRPRWPLAVAVAATSVLAVAVALWMRPTHHAAAPTAQTPQGGDASPTRAPAAIDKATLGVAAAAHSQTPRRVPLPVGVTSVSWNSAATWQQRRLPQPSQPAATWTAGPGTQGAPVERPEAAAPPTTPAGPPPVAPPAAKQPTRPQAVIKPDPVEAEPQPAAPRPAGPAMPDQPTNPN